MTSSKTGRSDPPDKHLPQEARAPEQTEPCTRSHLSLIIPRRSDRASYQDWIAQYRDKPVPEGLATAPLIAARMDERLRTVSLAGWRTPGLEQTEEELRCIHPSEGLDRVVEIIRQAPGFEVLDGGHISFDETLTGAPEATRARWRDALHSEFSDTALALAAQDPFRELDPLLPVGTVFDLKDVMFDREARESELYWQLYGHDYRNSWLGVVVERRGNKTWGLTMWHKVEDAERRLELRSALTRLAGALRVACHRIGLFEQSEIEVVQSIEEAGILLPQFHIDADFDNRPERGKITGEQSNSQLNNPKKPPLGTERTIEDLWRARERLQEALHETDQMLLDRLRFAQAVNISLFKAGAVQLVEGFQTDPRYVVIYVSRTAQNCIFQPTDPANLPARTTPISRLGQHGSRLVQEVYENRARSGARIGIRRGGARTGRVVAELCPPTIDSTAYISVLRALGTID